MGDSWLLVLYGPIFCDTSMNIGRVGGELKEKMTCHAMNPAEMIQTDLTLGKILPGWNRY